MSDEQRKDEESDLEAHAAHPHSANDEPAEDEESDFEAHVLVRYPNVRMD